MKNLVISVKILKLEGSERELSSQYPIHEYFSESSKKIESGLGGPISQILSENDKKTAAIIEW